MVGDIGAVVGVDPYGISMERFVSEIGMVSDFERQDLLRRCNESVGVAAILSDEASRVVLARTLVALLPESYPTIAECLNRRSDDLDYEIHFSLFCYLDWITEIPKAREAVPDILHCLKDYLYQVSVDTAYAAWMAGDLLGDHWLLEESVPLLISTAQEARHSIGRLAAIHGIEYALKRTGISPSDHVNLNATLRTVAETDRSEVVRDSAIYLIERLSTTAHPIC